MIEETTKPEKALSKSLTRHQRMAVDALLNGGYIFHSGTRGARVSDASGTPVVRLSIKSFDKLKSLDILKKKGHLFFISRKKIISFRGSTYVKRKYKEVLKKEQNIKRALKMNAPRIPEHPDAPPVLNQYNQ